MTRVAFKIKAEITGMQGILDRLKGLKQGARNKVLRPAVTAGAKVILTAAKTNLRGHNLKGTGLLLRSLGSKVKVTRAGLVMGLVGPRTGYKTVKGPGGRRRELTKLGAKFKEFGQNPIKYAHFVEFGTRAHSVARGASLKKKKGGGKQHPGAKAYPFLRPAVDEKVDSIRGAMVKAATAALAKLAIGGA